MKVYVAEVKSSYDYNGAPRTDDENLGPYPSPERAREAIAKFLKANNEPPAEWKDKWYEVAAEPDIGQAPYRFQSAHISNPPLGEGPWEFCYVMEYEL